MLTVAAFYCFAPFDAPERLRGPLLDQCRTAGVRGTILLAREGVNGTIAGQAEAVAGVIDHIRQWPGCAALDIKTAGASAMPFHRMKVRLKREIVTLGQPGIDPSRDVGRYVAPEEWNDLISDPDTVVIDTRNDYEVTIGSFAEAINPGTRSFSEFPEWWRANAEKFAGKRVAMFCTGGIRCEKSTAYLRAEGVTDVAHLKGGILAYLERIPEQDSLWQGECFVFDERVSVGHGVAQGQHVLCRACRMPLSPDDCGHAAYVEGVQCHHCADRRSDADRARYAERHRQVALAQSRGQDHVGGSGSP